jgi:hypothetical protein
VGLGVLAVLAVVALAVRLWPLLVAAAVVAVCYRLTVRRRAARPLSPRPSAPPWPAPLDLAAVAADRDRLAADLAAMTADRDRQAAEAAELRESAYLAWDAAASAPPRRRAASDDCPPDRRAALLAAPRSGARPLGGDPWE